MPLATLLCTWVGVGDEVGLGGSVTALEAWALAAVAVTLHPAPTALGCVCLA